MKAKDILAKSQVESPVDTMVNAITELIGETTQLVETRKIKAPRALIAIVNEQHQKWKTILRLMGQSEELFSNSYKEGLFTAIPDFKLLVEQMKPWTEKRYYRDRSRIHHDVLHYLKPVTF